MSEVLIEITFDSTALFTEDGAVGFRFTRGWPGEPPMTRGEDDTVAARAGRSPYPHISDVLPIGLEGWLHAGDGLDLATARETVEGARQALMDLFRGRIGTAGVLEAAMIDGSTATIAARVVPPVLTREVVPGLRYEFDVALESVDPEWVITPAGS